MSIESIRENIYASKCYDAQTLQFPIKQDMIVPDIKPDVAKILHVDPKITFEDMVVDANRVKFVGVADFNILYLSDGVDKTVHNISVSYPVEDFMNVDNITKDSMVKINGYIENCRVELLNSRKINLNCIVEIEVKFEVKYEKPVITDVVGLDDIQLKKKTLSARQLFIHKQEKFIVKDEIGIGVGKPNIREILWCDVCIKNKDIKVLDDKIAVKGDLNVCVLYAGESDDRNLEFIEKDVPFNGIIECLGATQEMYADIDMRIAKKYIQVIPDMDGEDRILELEIITDMNVKVYSLTKKDIISDCYCPCKKMIFNKEKADFQNLIFKNQMKGNINHNISIASDMPDIMQVLYVSAKPRVEDVKIDGDNVVAEGVVFTKVFFVAADDNNPLCSFDEVIPFEQKIKGRDLSPNNKVEIMASMEYATCNMLSNREVEIRCGVCFDTNVLDEKEYDLIMDIDDEDMDMDEIENMPSVVVYVISKEDSLWDIAKKYNTTMDELMQLNSLDNDNMMEGQKILILKKMYDEVD